MDHHPSLNTHLRPIVNQYREGKVKSTPVRGVKENLKPYVYKQSKIYERFSDVKGSDGVPLQLPMMWRVVLCSKVKPEVRRSRRRKPSLKWANGCIGQTRSGMI